MFNSTIERSRVEWALHKAGVQLYEIDDEWIERPNYEQNCFAVIIRDHPDRLSAAKFHRALAASIEDRTVRRQIDEAVFEEKPYGTVLYFPGFALKD